MRSFNFQALAPDTGYVSSLSFSFRSAIEYKSLFHAISHSFAQEAENK